MYICIFACILTDDGQTCCPNLQIFKFDKMQICRLSCKLHDNLHLVEHTNSFYLELLEELHWRRHILSWVLVGETFTNITYANLRDCSDTLFTSNLQMCFLQTGHWLVHANMQICIYIFNLLGHSNRASQCISLLLSLLKKDFLQNLINNITFCHINT